MRGTYSVQNSVRDRTIRIRMTGKFDATTMRAFAEDYRRATESYGGKSHLVLADMRGLLPVQPELGHIMSEAIQYCRARGVACCAHLSDDTVTRLQTARLARGSNLNDKLTVDVVSLEEAENVLNEVRATLKETGAISDRPHSGVLRAASTAQDEGELDAAAGRSFGNRPR